MPGAVVARAVDAGPYPTAPAITAAPDRLPIAQRTHRRPLIRLGSLMWSSSLAAPSLRFDVARAVTSVMPLYPQYGQIVEVSPRPVVARTTPRPRHGLGGDGGGLV